MGIFDKMKGTKGSGNRAPLLTDVEGDNLLVLKSMTLSESRKGHPFVKAEFRRVAAKGDAVSQIGRDAVYLYFPQHAKYQESDDARAKSMFNAIAGVDSNDTDTTDGDWIEAAIAGEGKKHAGTLVMARVEKNDNGYGKAFFEMVDGGGDALDENGHLTNDAIEFLSGEGWVTSAPA